MGVLSPVEKIDRLPFFAVSIFEAIQSISLKLFFFLFFNTIKSRLLICNNESTGTFFKVGTLDSNSNGGKNYEIGKKIFGKGPGRTSTRSNRNKRRFLGDQKARKTPRNEGNQAIIKGGVKNPPLVKMVFSLRRINVR